MQHCRIKILTYKLADGRLFTHPMALIKAHGTPCGYLMNVSSQIKNETTPILTRKELNKQVQILTKYFPQEYNTKATFKLF